MASLNRFEELEAWQKARELTQAIYRVATSDRFAKDFGLRDQICRAAVAVMSNVAEGFERGGNAEFIHFLAIARGSAGEVESQLYVALDQGYLTQERFAELYKLTGSTKRLIGGLVKYLKSSGLKGRTYKERGSYPEPETQNPEP